MTEEERASEFLKARDEADELTKDIRCLRARRDRYRSKLAYLVGCLDDYLKDPVDGGVQNSPDLKDWPNADDMRRLFDDTYTTGDRLREAKRRMRM